LLNYLNIEPRTSYLARLRNPNPKMPSASKVGRINAEHESGEQEQESRPPQQARTQASGGNA